MNFDDRIRAKFAHVERQREDMHGYQRDIAVPFMREHPFSLICIDMGLGKTVSALTVISDLLQEFATEKVLVIAPLRVATDTWPTEIAAWQHTAWMNYTLIRADGRRTKEDCARDPATIHVINREQVEWLVYFWKEKWPYRTVIIDECFIAGTPVATPNGDVAIEKLSVGDLVETPYGSMPVKKVHRKKTTRIVRVFLQNGTAIACTPEHRFLTDAGWLPACELEGRLLYDQSDFASLQVQALRRNILDLEVSPDLLRTFMFSKSGVAKRRNGERERSIEEWHSWKRENALEQRHPLAGRNEGQVASAWQQGAFSEDTRRERDRDVSPRKNVVRNVDQRLGLQPRGDCREGAGQRLSEPLQDRLRLAGEDDCFGSGWFEPQSDQTSSARSEERGSSCGTRVVRVSRDEQGSGVNVYDISVEGAPYYFAQGCLVHNCSSFKDHSSHRFKALAKVRRTDGLITRMHLLTATPAAETYEHLFTQLYLLDLGQRLGKNITWYRDAYFNYNKYSMKYKLRPGAEEVILEKIADISLVMKSKDYLPRTEPTVVQRKVKLSQHQLDLIRKLERDFIITLTDGTEIEAKTAAMLSSMLLQMASGSVYETRLVVPARAHIPSI